MFPDGVGYNTWNLNPTKSPDPAVTALPSSVSRPRIELIDALRGTALAGLFLLHCVEHFEMGGKPELAPAWLAALDGQVQRAAFFLFSGKAYAIFAALFGLSFFLQLESGARRGEDLRLRFVWRLVVLAAIGFVDGILFCGDILMVIAVLGLPLVALYRCSNRVLGWIAAFFLLQVPAWWMVVRVITAGYVPAEPVHWGMYGRQCEIFAHGSFLDVVQANLGVGQTLRFWFTYESHRYLQMFGLFVLGLLVGRSRVLEDAERARRFGWRALVGGVVGFVVASPLTDFVLSRVPGGVAHYLVGTVVWNLGGLAQIAIWVGAVAVLFSHGGPRRWLARLAPFGRMSLTAYLTQGWFWVVFYYGFGFAMYDRLGATLSVLVGIPFLVAQVAVANLWLRHFHYGPLEWFWRCGTRLSFATALRRRPALAVPASDQVAATVAD